MNTKRMVKAAAVEAVLAAVVVLAAPVQAKEWAFELSMDMEVSLPNFEISVPTLPEMPKDRCDRAERAINVLESSVLEIGAKYWAAKLRSKGFDVRSLTKNPGSDILDTDLRAKFYERLGAFYYLDAVEPSMFEVEQLTLVKAKIEKIMDQCGS